MALHQEFQTSRQTSQSNRTKLTYHVSYSEPRLQYKVKGTKCDDSCSCSHYNISAELKSLLGRSGGQAAKPHFRIPNLNTQCIKVETKRCFGVTVKIISKNHSLVMLSLRTKTRARRGFGFRGRLSFRVDQNKKMFGD